VAALVGVSPATIRVWERRHQIVVPGRNRFHHRRYTPADIEVLLRIRNSVRVEGMSLQKAAASARARRAERAARRLEQDQPAPSEADAAGAIARSSALWGMVTDLMREPIVVIDAAGRIVDANVAVARISGVLRGRLRGAAFADLVEPFDRAKAVAACRAPFRRLTGWELNLRTPRVADLYTFECWPLRAGARPLLAMIGRPIGASL
jgi:DNA-binding transcriptional MerR regulator